MTMMLWAFGLVFLCMMPLATSAAAECAWVLWERTWTDRSRWTWLISSREHWTPVTAVARFSNARVSASSKRERTANSPKFWRRLILRRMTRPSTLPGYVFPRPSTPAGPKRSK